MNANALIRFQVSGELTTGSPLHIGSGETRELRLYGGEKVEVAEVAKDHSEKPYLPATAIKALLLARAELKTGEENENRRKMLFGCGEEGGFYGGRLYFQDAPLADGRETMPLFSGPDDGSPPLYWDMDHHIYVKAGVAIDRITRTASRHKLYYHEMVPSGARFMVNIGGRNLTADLLAFLVGLLEEINGSSERGATLGAFGALGCGLVAWKKSEVTGLKTHEEVKAWLEGGYTGFAGMPRLAGAALDASTGQGREQKADKPGLMKIGITLAFDGPFLINDPSQARRDEQNPNESVGHAFLKGIDNKGALTASSLKGAMRFQAERIARTIFGDFLPHGCGQAGGGGRRSACYIDSRQKEESCAELLHYEDRDKLCLTCRLFGGVGWRSPLVFSDLELLDHDSVKEFTQEFVAIDRFTGGAAEKKKFKAKYLYRPKFKGSLYLETDRVSDEHVGLLALTLRDLLEGDIPLGYGCAKGFGRSRGELEGFDLKDYATQVSALWKLGEGGD